MVRTCSEHISETFENAVRKAKRKVEGLSDPENVKKAKAELRDAQKQLKDFINKVNADEGETILKRDYGREKIYSDIPKNRIDNSGGSGIMNIRNISTRNMPNGLRTAPSHILTEEEISSLKKDILEIGADESVFKFNTGRRTGYDDILDEIRVRGDVLPDTNSNHPRDKMSARAALAHEYYGHRSYRGTKLPKGAWNDEFRASYMAAKNCPNLSDEDRMYLILDALERAKESGVTIKNNKFIRRILYGY